MEFQGKTDSNASKIKIVWSQSTDDTDRARCLAVIFEKAHIITATYTHANDSVARQSLSASSMFARFGCDAPTIDIHEIKIIIKSLEPFKSPGPDKTQNFLIKHLPASAIEWIMINKCLELSYWPMSFKTVKVIPILKSGSPEFSGHRPICWKWIDNTSSFRLSIVWETRKFHTDTDPIRHFSDIGRIDVRILTIGRVISYQRELISLL